MNNSPSQSPTPEALRSAFLVAFFSRVMVRHMRRHFHAVRLSRAERPDLSQDRPAVVYTNHPSWWDAALLIVLATRLFPERWSYGPIDSSALSKYRFMSRIGLFGLDPGPAGAKTFLRAAQRILADKRTMLWVTAEGQFCDPRRRPVQLRPGVAHLAKNTPGALVIPLAVEYPFWDERTPEALCRFGAPLHSSSFAGRDVADVNAILTAHLTRTMDSLAAESIARDPAAFDTLLEGVVGIGGPYDWWRRARAALAGKQFHPGHGARR